MYTLKDLYIESGIKDIPDPAEKIELRHPIKGTPLKPYWPQIEALNLAMTTANSRCALFDDMGSGKTMPFQAWGIWYAFSGVRVVYVMPHNLIKQFQKSWVRTFVGIDQYFVPARYHADKKTRDRLAEEWARNCPRVVVTSYDIFRKEFVLFKALDFMVLGMDECQIMGETNNIGYEAVEKFMGPQGEKACMLMTGTPAEAKLVRLFGYINFLTPGVYRNITQFYKLHVIEKEVAVKQRNRQGRLVERAIDLITGYKNKELLYKNLYLQARRVEKEQVMDIEPVSVLPYEFELSERHEKLYKKMVAERMLEFEDGSILDATTSTSMREHAIMAIMHPSDLGIHNEVSGLFKGLDELLAQIGIREKKVLLMAHHRKNIEALAERYSKYNPAVIYGGSNTEKEKMKFIEDDECRLCIINFKAGGVGLDGLQFVSWFGVVCEPITSAGIVDQAIARLRRGGQEHKVTIYYLTCPGTIYAKIIEQEDKNRDHIQSVVSREALLNGLLGRDEEGHAEEVEEPLNGW